MTELLKKFDDLAAVQVENKFARLLERIAFVLMILMFAFAPHSIAATQIAWLTGMFAWLVRRFISPRTPLVRTPLDAPLWIFFAWSLLTSIFSYDPPTSLDKLRNVALFLIFYYIVNVLKTKRAVVFMASTLILSAMVSVVWTPIERVFGRGVEILNVGAASPFSPTILTGGDTILKVGDKKVSTPEDVLAEIEKSETANIYFYRPDFYLTVPVKRADLLDGGDALERLGIGGWKPSRNWRSAGFLSHYATFAEILQLITALVFGLFIASFGRVKAVQSKDSNAVKNPSPFFTFAPFHLFTFSPSLLFCVAAMAFALLLTVTRASQIGFLIAAFFIVYFGANRKLLLIAALIVLPTALAGVYFIQQSRNVGYFDVNDESTRDRFTFYRRGFNLWTENARNFSIGVGMDSNKRYIKEWNLYDNQGNPMGHFHSTPLQLVVERGLPALFLWVWVLWVYGRTLLRHLKNQHSSADWRERGIILGAFGGLVGFTVAGLVHYNLGTAMVAMVFFMMMGLSFALITPLSQISRVGES